MEATQTRPFRYTKPITVTATPDAIDYRPSEYSGLRLSGDIQPDPSPVSEFPDAIDYSPSDLPVRGLDVPQPPQTVDVSASAPSIKPESINLKPPPIYGTADVEPVASRLSPRLKTPTPPMPAVPRRASLDDYFESVGSRENGIRYVVPHGNEETAKKVARDQISADGGTGYVARSKDRNTLGVDPNSSFGAKNKFSPYADEMETKLFGGDLVVALHNTTADALAMEKDRNDEVVVNNPKYKGYIMTTDPAVFAELKASPYNVVLQYKSKPKNDQNSLSRRAESVGKKYINVEAEMGDEKGQKAMLDAALKAHRKVNGIANRSSR